MKDSKKAVIRELKNTGSQGNKDIIVRIEKSETDEEIVKILLENGYVEIFVKCFEPKEIKKLWQEWAIKDYLEVRAFDIKSKDAHNRFTEKNSNHRSLISRIQKAIEEKINNSDSTSIEAEELTELNRFFQF